MIRIACFEAYESGFLDALKSHLYTSFGIGCELSKPVEAPLGSGPVDGYWLLNSAPKVDGLPGDCILYLTQRKLLPRALLTGTLPTLSLSQPQKRRALLSLPPREALASSPEEPLSNEPLLKHIFRLALSELGHCFGLHHCLDPRCAMYPPWTLSQSNAEVAFCSFCRVLSERHIRAQKV